MEGIDRPAEFDAAVVAQRKTMMAFAMSLVGDRDRAEDLVSDAIVRALANHHQFQAGTNLRGWLCTILRNGLFTQHRKSGREVSDPDGVFAALMPINEGQTWAYDLKVIRKRMRIMNPDLRRAAELVAILGHEYEEVAEMLGVPVGTIKSRVNRARHFLETGEEQEEIIEIDTPPQISSAQRIEELYRQGLSIAEIKAYVDGVTRSEIMQVILDRKLSAKRA